MKTRNTNIELLRIIFMSLILTLHVYGHGSRLNYEWIYGLGTDWATAWNLSLFSLGKIGVTGFIFISGYFGIKTNRKNIIHLLTITFFYALIFYISFRHYHLREIIYLVFAFDFWWFVSCYFFIMLLAPFIEEGIKKISEQKFLLLLSGMFFYTYVMRFYNKANSHDIILLLSVYMGARYLKYYPKSKLSTIVLQWGALSFVLILFVPVAIMQIGWKTDMLMPCFIQNNNILLFIASYWLIYKCEQYVYYNKNLNRLASGSLAIYLVTDYHDVRNLLDPWLLPNLLRGYGLFLIAGICIAILIFALFRGWIFDRISLILKRLFMNS